MAQPSHLFTTFTHQTTTQLYCTNKIQRQVKRCIFCIIFSCPFVIWYLICYPLELRKCTLSLPIHLPQKSINTNLFSFTIRWPTFSLGKQNREKEKASYIYCVLAVEAICIKRKSAFKVFPVFSNENKYFFLVFLRVGIWYKVFCLLLICFRNLGSGERKYGENWVKYSSFTINCT